MLNRFRALRACLAGILLATGIVVFSPAQSAHADGPCVNGGVYVLFARGSGEHLNDLRANQFYWSLIGTDQYPGALRGKVDVQWGELGNVEGDVYVDMEHNPSTYTNPPKPNDPDEYPAIGDIRVVSSWLYSDSVAKGTNELVTHLNDRAARCPTETTVLGGFSQGADVVGWALQRSDLSAAARNHVGFAALYGDPKFDPGPLQDRRQDTNFDTNWWWVRGQGHGYHFLGSNDNVKRDTGYHGARQPYTPPGFKGRLGSWCAFNDGICTGMFWEGTFFGSHNDAYQTVAGKPSWIQRSAPEIAWQAIQRRNQLNPGLLPATTAGYSIPPITPEGEPITNNPPPPVVKSVKRRTDHVGTYQVYAATSQAVTEAWWRPGEDVQTKEIIHISQDNIVGFDKVNEPDGTTQSLYTAVPDGVWETWWRPGDGPHSTKIVTGLTGVRQVIADPVTDGGQYTHRLYLLASDGPYEVWWREGGDGIHVNRLDIVNDPVTMTKSRGPDGTDQLYVATPTWVYELWWRPDTAVNHGSVINITQGDIRSLDKGANLPDGGQLLYTGTSTTGWQTYWNSANGTGISHGTITVGQSNAGQIKKTVYNGVHQLYQTNGCRVQENWWDGPSSGSSTLINISQCNITSFDKSADGPDQQVYTASGDLVYETWWRGGSNPSGPNTSVLFKVAR